MNASEKQAQPQRYLPVGQRLWRIPTQAGTLSRRGRAKVERKAPTASPPANTIHSDRNGTGGIRPVP